MASPNDWMPWVIYLFFIIAGSFFFLCCFVLTQFRHSAPLNRTCWQKDVVNTGARMWPRFSQQPGTIPYDTLRILSDIWAARETLSHRSWPVTIHNDLWPCELLSRHHGGGGHWGTVRTKQGGISPQWLTSVAFVSSFNWTEHSTHICKVLMSAHSGWRGGGGGISSR